MSLLSRFAHKKETVSLPQMSAECSHRELAPRWDSAADMGKKDCVSSYRCTSCGREISTEEARSLSADV